MKRILTILTFSCITLFAAASSATADVPGNSQIVITKPDKWNSESLNSGDARIAGFSNPENESRIEVYKHQLSRTAHADILFDAFQKKLQDDNFKVTVDKKNYKFDLTNGQTRTGHYSEYEYSDSEVPIAIVTYAFSVEGEQSMVYFIVGYFATANRTDAMEEFESFVRTVVDAPKKD